MGFFNSIASNFKGAAAGWYAGKVRTLAEKEYDLRPGTIPMEFWNDWDTKVVVEQNRINNVPAEVACHFFMMGFIGFMESIHERQFGGPIAGW